MEMEQIKILKQEEYNCINILEIIKELNKILDYIMSKDCCLSLSSSLSKEELEQLQVLSNKLNTNCTNCLSEMEDFLNTYPINRNKEGW